VLSTVSSTLGNIVETVEDYHRYAADCDALARTALTENQRQQIQAIAETWRKLAAARERKLRSQQHLQKPSE
jgi:hypothetical protein